MRNSATPNPQFKKGAELIIGTHNEPVSVAMCVN
jgi:hypothetical protein